MKGLFRSALMAAVTALGVWWYSRQQMDDLYAEIGQLREEERRRQEHEDDQA